jgi:hypothetical protein
MPLHKTLHDGPPHDVSPKTSYGNRHGALHLLVAALPHRATSLGRWLTPDPKRGNPFNPQSWNRYAYVLDNPINFTDPYGLVNYWKVAQGAGWSVLGAIQVGASVVVAGGSEGTLAWVAVGMATAGVGTFVGGFTEFMGGWKDTDTSETQNLVQAAATPPGIAVIAGTAAVTGGNQAAIQHAAAVVNQLLNVLLPTNVVLPTMEPGDPPPLVILPPTTVTVSSDPPDDIPTVTEPVGGQLVDPSGTSASTGDQGGWRWRQRRSVRQRSDARRMC